MASSIDASTSGAGGVITTADNTGILQLKTAGVVAVTVNASSALGVGTSPSFGTSGQVLTSSGTSAAPTWSTISSGGMTLLGTLTTTSGTTQTLSGLTLTSYKQLNITYNNVGYTSGAAGEFRIAGVTITQSGFLSNTTAVYGGMNIDLSTGATFGCVEAGYINAGVSNSIVFVGQAGPLAGNLSTINTSTTSIAFTFSGGQTFASGTIKVYGVA
jgi:hypothetical protein